MYKREAYVYSVNIGRYTSLHISLQDVCSKMAWLTVQDTHAWMQTEQAHVYSVRTGHQTLIFSEMKRLLLYAILPKCLQCI